MTNSTPDRASLDDDTEGWNMWKDAMSKLALFKLPALFILLVILAAHFWGTMGIVGVLATTSVVAAVGYLLKEL